MLRLIHCADIHLGSKMTSSLPFTIAEERKAELRAAFARMLDFAEKTGVKAVLIAGDAFDSDRPLKHDKAYFYGVIRNHPNIDFLYLKGNHDILQSYEESLPNLKTFSQAWSYYSYGKVDIYGAEFSNGTCLPYSSLSTLKERKNIVLLHGQPSNGGDKYEINLKNLTGKHIDYLALGHLHTHTEGRLDERGKYAFSGCLEGRGFDETGAKGFILLETDEMTGLGGIKSTFVINNTRSFEERTVDVSDTSDPFAACALVKSLLPTDGRNLYRVKLTGRVGFDNRSLARDVEKYLQSAYYFIQVKNQTSRTFAIDEFIGDLSLRGEFVRGVLKDTALTEQEKGEILSLGLKVLDGGELDE